MEISTQSHNDNNDNNDSKSIHSTSKRVTRIELIVGMIAFVLLALLADKIRSSERSVSSVTQADLRDIEYTVSYLQNTLNRDTTKHASMISELNDKIFHIQQHLSQISKKKTRDTETVTPSRTLALFNTASKQASRETYHKSYISMLSEAYQAAPQTNTANLGKKTERKLSVFDMAAKNDTTSLRRCDERPLLSPTNHLSNFVYDERIVPLIEMIHTLSHVEEVNNIYTPQYKAACWILFDDELEMSTADYFFLQRYVLAVLVSSFYPNEPIQLPKDICDHEIATCNDDRLITSIALPRAPNIPDDDFERTFPVELCNLRYLEALHLENSAIYGTLPSLIGRLSNLQWLNLDHNFLAGTIPSQIGKLASLKGINLGWNQLSGSIPSELGHCEDLARIILLRNGLTGTLPTELFGCTKLEIIDFSLNGLNGSIPDEISQLNGLLRIEFSSNNFTGPIPSNIGHLLQLKDLWLSFNQLTGTLPTELGKLHNLDRLVVADNKLTGTVPDIFGNFPNMLTLALSINGFSGEIPSSIWSLDNFDHPNSGLILHGNNLHGTVPDDVCAKVSTLQLDDSKWFVDEPKVRCDCCNKATCNIWETDADVVDGTLRQPCPIANEHTITFFERYWIEDNIANVTLNKFHGRGNSFSAEVCLSPTGCYRLYDPDKQQLDHDLNYTASSQGLSKQDTCGAVNICDTSFDQNHPRRNALNHLTQIALMDASKLEDPSSADYKALCWILTEDVLYDDYEICDGTLLQRYVIMLFAFRQEKIELLEEVKFLHTCEFPGVTCGPDNNFIEEINLPSRSLTGPLMPELGLLTRLRKLDMSENSLTGMIHPFVFSSKPNLEEIHLGHNEIRGKIPDEIFISPKLKKLNISHNVITGTLPSDIAYSPQLESIDLANNLIQGSIPDALIKCRMLEKITLSRNSFIHTIPSQIGLLDKLRVLELDVNRLTGSLPLQIFNAKELQTVAFSENLLTGRIPTQIGNLLHAEIVSFSHNILRGKIPVEMENLKNLRVLHLHDNFLTGIAPTIELVEPKSFSYISDCGRPFFALPGSLECKSCTMCCNSLKKCQLNQNSLEIPVQAVGYMIPLVTAVGFTMVMSVLFYFTNLKNQPMAQHKLDSVYCLVYSDNLLAWVIYLVTATIQALAFWIFLKRSNFNDDETEWSFTYRCSVNNRQCINEGSRTWFGWVMLVLMLIYFLGSDFIDGFNQLRKAVYLRNVRLLISGLVLFFLTGLAFITSIVYNLALAESDPELIVNAVFLLFINDMDEKFLDLLVSLVPNWIDKRQLEIEEVIKAKRKSVTEAGSESHLNFKSTHSEEDGLNIADKVDRHEIGLQRLGSRRKLEIESVNSTNNYMEGRHETGVQRLGSRRKLEIESVNRTNNYMEGRHENGLQRLGSRLELEISSVKEDQNESDD